MTSAFPPLVTSAFPPLDRFMPHRPPMRMIDAMITHTADECVCVKTFHRGDPLVEGDSVTSLVAIELFAQTAAAHFGYSGFVLGGAMTSGALLGTRKIDLAVGSFAIETEIVVRVKQLFAIPPAAQFECALEIGGALVASGTINVAMGAPPAT